MLITASGPSKVKIAANQTKQMYKIYIKYKDTSMPLYSKLMLIMRLTTVILIASFLQVSASTFGQQITLKRKGASLESVFREIRAQTGYDFLYDGKIVPINKLINISLEKVDINAAIKAALADLPFVYKIEGRIVSIKKRDEPSALENFLLKLKKIDVRGRVTDSSGNPLTGATVLVKGGTAKAITNDKGVFYLHSIAEDAIILISYIGFEVREVKANENIGDIRLETLSSTLNEVDVTYSTGYQRLSRERSAGSFSKPDIGTMLNRSSSTSILQRLDGLVPGLTVNNAPDAKSNPFLIRGLTSINATRGPLVVVDGVEVSAIENVNMQDIADITVLKDATSASIWGAKAANGVIVITTKKGKSGDKLRIDYDGYYSFQGRPDRNYIPRMSSQQFIATAKELFPQYAPSNPWSTVSILTTVPPHLQIQYDRSRNLISQADADFKLDSLAAISNTDQINDLFIRDAGTLNQTLSLSGGGKVHSFYGSFNHISVRNNTPGEKDNRYKLNLRQDFNLSKRIQAYLITDLTNSVSGGNNLSLSEFNIIPDVDVVPYQLFKDGSGNPITVNHLGRYSDVRRLDYQARSRINLDYVPLDEINNGYTKGTALAGRIVGGATVNLIKGLRFQGTYGYNVSSSNKRTVLDQKSYLVRDTVMIFTQAPTLDAVPIYNIPANGGRLTEYNAVTKNWTIRNQLLYDAEWMDHQLTVMAGQEATSTTPVSTNTIYRGWNDALQISQPIDNASLAKGITGTVPGDTRTMENGLSGGEGIITRTTSYYANGGYTYQRKYTLNASWRIDKSNLFGFDKSAQNRPVWSVGSKWAMGAEQFMKPLDWIERLDLRFTYGITGNAPIPGTAASFDILQAEANANYPTGVGAVISAPANSKLTWESTKVYNAGIDFAIFKGRIGGSIDVYSKKTQDLIGTLNTSPLTGYAGVTGNFGNLENKGIDIGLNSINLTGTDFLWTSGFTLGYNKNKITELAASTPVTTGEAMIRTRYLAGYSAFMLSAYNYAGLNAVGDPQIILANGEVTADPTGSKAEDVQYMGTTQPVWSGGISNNFQYKNFSLGINISYNAGHTLFRDVNTFWSGVLYRNSMHSEFANRWKQPGDENTTNIPRYTATTGEESSRNISYYTYGNINTFDASFAKIRDITLSYSIPKLLVQRLKAQAITFRLQVSNLMLWKANDLGIDPEFQSVGSFGATRNVRTGQGTLTFGAHITL
jgi:TonB-linked SusC/RagA family outer membrane protein